MTGNRRERRLTLGGLAQSGFERLAFPSTFGGVSSRRHAFSLYGARLRAGVRDMRVLDLTQIATLRSPAGHRSVMATNGSIFSAMLEEFDGAARILNLEPGIWKILTHPKRQIT